MGVSGISGRVSDVILMWGGTVRTLGARRAAERVPGWVFVCGNPSRSSQRPAGIGGRTKALRRRRNSKFAGFLMPLFCYTNPAELIGMFSSFNVFKKGLLTPNFFLYRLGYFSMPPVIFFFLVYYFFIEVKFKYNEKQFSNIRFDEFC